MTRQGRCLTGLSLLRAFFITFRAIARVLRNLAPDLVEAGDPYRVAWEINEFLTDDTIYIGDGGDVVTISAQAVRPRRPGNWMDPGALGSLGIGTGFAMAAKLAHPDKEVLCYYGDGSFGMTAFDMETANRFGAPYIAVIGNNSAMNQIRYGQIAKYGEQRGNVGNLLGDVPFGKFGEMLGGNDHDRVGAAGLEC